MHSLPRSPIAVLLAGLLLILAGTGCDGCTDSPTPEQERPWKVASETAPYELVFPAEWTAEPPEAINSHADIAAHRDDKFFFMVIPQVIPEFPKTDVFALQQIGMEMLDESLENLVLERQGPLELDGVSGLTVFARGEIDGESIQYITSYAIHRDIGYQIIAFSEKEHATELFRDKDVILSGWKFIDETDEAPSAEPSDNGETSLGSGALPESDEQAPLE